MDNDKRPPEKDSCVRCRWVEMHPRPYAAIDYYCTSRQESIPTEVLIKRICPRFTA